MLNSDSISVQYPGEWVGLRILVVENNGGTAERTADLLRADGHRVQTISDAESALRTAQGEQPDVVMVDTDLPGTDGLQLAEQLWRLSKHPKAPSHCPHRAGAEARPGSLC